MINIKIYNNGYEIIGHAKPDICSEVSFWRYISSNILLGFDPKAKEYTSSYDNKENPQEGYSWTTFNPKIDNLEWLFEDFVLSLEEWAEKYYESSVSIERIEKDLIKDLEESNG